MAATEVLRDIEALLQRLEKERPTLATIVRRNFVSGELQGDSVCMRLFPPPPRDRDLLEDPLELNALARLPWSPGPWQFTFEEAEKALDDPIVDSLLSSFDGQEETP